MRRERGVALVLALLLVAAAALFALTVANRSRDVAMDGVRDRASARARAAAEGGVERARWALARDADYSGETVTIGACDVVIHVATAADGALSVTSIASAPAAPFAAGVTRRTEADVVLRGDALPQVVAWREAR